MKTYYTHDNGGRPFKVIVDKDNHLITVYQQTDYDRNSESFIYSSDPIFYREYTQLFVGKTYKNSMTNFSGGNGTGFIGNSILIKNDEGNNYTFIGHSIFSFQTLSPIVKYKSPVGNNDVPYPFAIDENGSYYLLIENVIINPMLKPQNKDVYQYYYSECKIKGYSLLVESLHREDNNEDETYWLQYQTEPEKTFNRIVPAGSKLYIVENNSNNTNSRIRQNNTINIDTKVEYSKEQYIQYIENIGREKGFQPFINKVEIRSRI